MEKETFERYEGLLRRYIEENADTALKAPVHYLKHPFVDPGSMYDGNLWDWDSFWAVYALFNLIDGTSDAERLDRYIRHAQGNVRNFLDYQLEDGYIPMMVATLDLNSELPEPYLIMKRKEGIVMNMHKPFLCQQIALIGGFGGDYEWIREDFAKLEKYFDCYDSGYFNENCGLYVWADDIMIGMDNDPATFGRPRYATANVYLNAFMVSELKAMAEIAARLGMAERAEHYRAKAGALADAIQAECWDKRDKFFYSADADIKTRHFDWFHQGLGVFWKTLPIKIRTWTGFIPLWAGVGDASQAAYLAGSHYLDKNTFNSPYGVTTLAQDEKMFDVSATNNPSNWLGPIWIVASYVVFRGLMNYGHVEEARELCEKTVLLLGQDLERTGTLHEYYVPSTGEPVMNGGFLNWNLLVINMIDELAGKKPMCAYWLG
ncbi:trehalase family glycosidase [Cohnella ginsengisoli]|uniref:Trehalase family glycosidase n=1 Tax=Cohnella ginsengisoli TaxID=425004 RepID=A0A9X4KFN6_9BACL|nr:trehalase family glycosidase [Cohnella ginsengisoli]MDG0790936.1 trehalase family glycosidase [Cohnella ginsengisoli]